MIAFLPPSSRWTCLRFSAAAFVTATPVSREPVKVMIGTSGCSTSRWPTSLPPPWTMLRTPFGEELHVALAQRWRVGCGLEDDRIAADDCRERLPGRDRDRKVPRCDRTYDADRHPRRHLELVAQLGWRRLAEQTPALAAHVVGHVDRFLDVAGGLGPDLPHLVGHQLGDVVLVIGEQLCEAEENLAALRGRDEPPVLVGRSGRRDRAVDVLGPRLREDADRLAVRRARRLEGPAGSSVDPLAVDVVLERLRAESRHRQRF